MRLGGARRACAGGGSWWRRRAPRSDCRRPPGCEEGLPGQRAQHAQQAPACTQAKQRRAPALVGGGSRHSNITPIDITHRYSSAGAQMMPIPSDFEPQNNDPAPRHAPVLVGGGGRGAGAAALALAHRAQQAPAAVVGLHHHRVAQAAACGRQGTERKRGRRRVSGRVGAVVGLRHHPVAQAATSGRAARCAGWCWSVSVRLCSAAQLQPVCTHSPGLMCSMGCPASMPSQYPLSSSLLVVLAVLLDMVPPPPSASAPTPAAGTLGGRGAAGTTGFSL